MTMTAGRYVLAAEKLLDALGPGSALIGGVAVNAYGFPRGTRDVDVITNLPLAQALEKLRAHGIAAEFRRGDSLDGDVDCLSGVVGVRAGAGRREEGVPFDVLPNLIAFGVEEIRVAGRRLRIVDSVSLVRLKLKAGASRDLYDVAVLARLDPRLAVTAKAVAAGDATLAARLAVFLDDPRTKKQAAEIRRQDAALARFERKRPKRT